MLRILVVLIAFSCVHNVVKCLLTDKKHGIEYLLYRDLFTNYNNGARPIRNASEALNVDFGLALNQILDLEEKRQVLTSAVWIYEEWFDDNLQWDPEKYNGLDTLIIPSTRIWLPDVFLFNTAGENLDGFVNVTGSKAMVRYDGLIRWMIPIMLKSSCGVDVTYFPYDYQKCELRFGSWVYDITQMDMHLKPAEVDISSYVVNSEYDLINVSVTRSLVDGSCCPGGGTHSIISVFIHVKRKSLYYDYIVIAPTIMLCFMTLFTFFLPCHKGEKIAIGLTVFLTLYVVQLFIAENVPDTNSTPILGVFLLMVMTFNCVSLIMATLVMNIKKRGEEEKCPDVPKWLLWLCHVVLSKIALTKFIWQDTCPGVDEKDGDVIEPDSKSCIQNHHFKNQEPISNADSDKSRNLDNEVAVINDYTSTNTSRFKVRNRKFVSPSERNDVICEPMLQNTNFQHDNEVKSAYDHALFMRRQWFFVAEVVDKFSFLIYLISMSFSILMVLFVIPFYFSDARTA
ncbi:hypothetical protein SNE40_011560 [Patella caerulea]|uniref:Uncharacterized protein n=1 Tax=Patella caerulea TaxID=87958 RepID=A0AAN8JS79_PATCE